MRAILLSTTLVISPLATPGAFGQNLDDRLQAHRAATIERMEREHARRAAVALEMERLMRLSDEERAQYFRSDLESRLSNIPIPAFAPTDDPLLEILRGFSYEVEEANGARQITVRSGPRLVASGAVGEVISFSLDGGSIAILVKESSQPERLRLEFADFVYELNLASNHVELETYAITQNFRTLLEKATFGGDLVEVAVEREPLQEALILLRLASNIPMALADGIPVRLMTMDVANRPIEATLSALSLQFGNTENRGIVWEAVDNSGYLIRPFPVALDGFALLASSARLVSIDNSESATIALSGTPKSIRINETIPVTFANGTSITGRVANIDPDHNEVRIVAAGGQQVILSALPETASQTIIQTIILGPLPQRAYPVMSRRTGILLHPAPGTEGLPLYFDGEARSLGEIVEQIMQEKGWSLRWMDHENIMIGPQSFLTSSDFPRGEN